MTPKRQDTMSKTTSDAREEIKWNERYQNPKADIVLRSADGMLFKVFAWDLARESSVFKGMFTHPDPSLTPIVLDLSSNALTTLLDSFAGSERRMHGARLSALDLCELRNFIDKFDFADLRPALDMETESLLSKPSSWYEVLVVVSNRHDLGFARTVLDAITSDTFSPTFWQYVDRIEPRWRNAILDAMFGTCDLDKLGPKGGHLSLHVLYRANAIPGTWSWVVPKGPKQWIVNFDPYKEHPLTLEEVKALKFPLDPRVKCEIAPPIMAKSNDSKQATRQAVRQSKRAKRKREPNPIAQTGRIRSPPARRCKVTKRVRI